MQGLTVDCGTVEIDEASIVAFAKEYDPVPFHVDPAADGPYSGLVASGWHTAALAMRQAVDHYLSAESILGGASVEEVRWPCPVRPGDTLRVRTSVLDARRSQSKPDRGILRTLVEAVNQDDMTVVHLTAINFIRVRPGTGP